MSKAKRNKEIVKRVKAYEESLADIAGDYGLTYQRIRQIAHETGVDTRGRTQKVTKNFRLWWVQGIVGEVLDLYSQLPSAKKVAARLNIALQDVEEVLRLHPVPETLKRANTLERFENSSYSKEDLCKALRKASREVSDGKHLRESWYKDLQEQYSGVYPNNMTIRNRFGGWDAALEAAGLTPLKWRVTDEDRINALQEAMDVLGSLPTHTTYAKYREEQAPHLPSSASFYRDGETWLDWLTKVEK